jgi:UDP-4-amino-4,6-dideoxy-N-acetyl-beta-L-altrosamine N-acetyltransferase
MQALPDQVVLRPMVATDLAMVFSWRNAPETKRFMLSQTDISFLEHQTWFARAVNDPRIHLMICERNCDPMGFMQFRDAKKNGVLDWGFYVRPQIQKGTGSIMCAAALRYAFIELRAHKVCGQVLAYNEASSRLHSRLGFELEGVLRDQHCIDGDYVSVNCFGLLKSEWKIGSVALAPANTLPKGN